MGDGLYNLLIRQETHIYHWFNIFNVQIRLNAFFALLFTIFCLLNTGFKWTHYTSFGILKRVIILKDSRCAWTIWCDLISFTYFAAFHFRIFRSFRKVDWNNCVTHDQVKLSNHIVDACNYLNTIQLILKSFWFINTMMSLNNLLFIRSN
jgi:hypothetical protein